MSSRLPTLRHEEDFQNWKSELVEAVMLLGYDEDVVLRGAPMSSADKTNILDKMVISLQHYRARLQAVFSTTPTAEVHPKMLCDTIKRFIIGDLTNELKGVRPGQGFATWATYVTRIVYLKRRLGELGSPVNDETAVTLVMEGIGRDHPALYGRLAQGMGRSGSNWSMLVADLGRVAAKYGDMEPSTCWDLAGLPSVAAAFGPAAGADDHRLEGPELEILEVRQVQH